jgi:two-component system chemotaxis response regulator CheB
MTTSTPPIKVLVVDDSAFARKVVREILAADHRLEVVGIARDGLEALEAIADLRPDVVTLDLVMPNLDGVGMLRALAPAMRARTVLVSVSDGESDLGVEALQLGAFDLVHKPTALATVRLYDLGDELIRKVIAAASAGPPAEALAGVSSDESPTPLSTPIAAGLPQIVVVGTSTGGPQALTRLLTGLPADFPIPLAIALHIPAGYTESLARRLNDASAISVVEASDGLALRPGLAVVARGGRHLELARGGAGQPVTARLGDSSKNEPYTPSVNVLFRSAAQVYGKGVLAVVLTGMGEDGLAGAREVRQAGGVIYSESESSCVVYGMPRAVWDAGIVTVRAPLDRLVRRIVGLVRGGGGAGPV